MPNDDNFSIEPSVLPLMPNPPKTKISIFGKVVIAAMAGCALVVIAASLAGSPDPAPIPLTDEETAFLSDVHSMDKYGEFEDTSDTQLLNLAHQMCDTISEDGTVRSVGLTYALESGIDNGTGLVLDIAIARICPEWSWGWDQMTYH